MEELELEVVTLGLKGLCVMIIVEPEIWGEIRFRKMEDPILKKIHDNLAMKPNSKFRMVDGVLKFHNRMCLPNVVNIKQQIMDKGHKSKWAIHLGMMKMYQDLKKMY